MKTFLLLTAPVAFMLSWHLSIHSQPLPIAREIVSTYSNGTRSADGNPGPNYWQNTADYSINVELARRRITASATITNFNNSPDTFKSIVFKLHQNMYKKGAARVSELTPEALTDGLVLTSMKVGDEEIDLAPESKAIRPLGTNAIIRMKRPIVPGASRSVSTSWNMTIPKGTPIRMGTCDSSTFFVGYWYPRVAVYDDVHGWDLSSNDGEHEFYNEYGNMSVAITVPHGFRVWATGTLTNIRNVLMKKILSFP